MGHLMVRKKSGLALAGKIGVALVVCWVALQVLPMVLGAGIVVGILGLAVTGIVVNLLSWMLSIGLYIGVPVFAILFLISLFSRDD